MTHLGLFEGIGGFSLAARWAGWQTPVMVEWNTYCQAVLKKNFPDATIFGDIHKFDGRPYAGQIDIITGGFPCQPFSQAGKRAGKDDDRYLWPEMLRVIREVAPTWVVGENVAGLITMDSGRVFAGILADLENAGYSTEAYIIPAIGVGAPHRRDRVWIIAHSDTRDRAVPVQPPGQRWEGENINASGQDFGDTSDAKCGAWKTRWRKSADGLQKQKQDNRHDIRGGIKANNWEEHWYEVAARLCRVDDGISGGVDANRRNKGKRLSALGNAIVPQIAYQFFDAINQFKK